MTEEQKQKLVDIKILITIKQKYTGEERTQIYNLYNEITGENRKPNGCSACLNSVLTRLKKLCRLHGI